MRVLTMVISALALFASVASAAPLPYDARQSLARRDIVHEPGHDQGTPPSPRAAIIGTYVISNLANGPNDEKLAITYNSQGTPLTVAPAASGSASQQWIIADENGGKSVKPVSAPALEAAWGANGVALVPSGSFVWTVNPNDNGYNIQDGKGTVFWGLESAINGAQITIGAGTGDTKQTWVFEKVG